MTEMILKAHKFQPKMYEVTDETGTMKVNEVAQFTQEDLDGDDVMIVDAGEVIYVWVGKGANSKEKTEADKTAHKFLSLSATPRPNAAKVVTIKQDAEPDDFKKLFPTWSMKFFVVGGDFLGNFCRTTR